MGSFCSPKGRKKEAELAHQHFCRGTQGDHIALLNVYNEWKASNYSEFFCRDFFLQHRSLERARAIREQLCNLCERVEVELTSNEGDYSNIRKALCEGFFANIAKNVKDKEYEYGSDWWVL